MSEDLTFNKIAAAGLTAGIIYMVIGLAGDHLVTPKPLAQNAYVVALPDKPAAAAEAEPAQAGGELVPVSPLLANASAAEGEAVAKKCTACHTVVKGGANKVGPNLWNIVDRKHAAISEFKYSDAMAATADKTWGYEELNHFLASPKGYIAGTKMSFAGLTKVEDRANLIAYLRGLSDSPAKLP